MRTSRAISGVLGSCFTNGGQVCVAQTRLLVAEGDLVRVEALCREAAASWAVGHPLDPATRLGPLASASGRMRVREILRISGAEGARLVCGGPEAPDGFDIGYYVRPTILADVTPAMTVAREEVFGPVLAILTYRDLDEAVEIANAPGGIWSRDRDAAVALARRMMTGQVSLNGSPQNYATPFGGRGLSGFGRENGRFSIEAFLEYKATHGALTFA